ncbi:hypothetical protein M153_220003356 [Pseudoloma neurophilia]|uniref:Uncharacterized protein n=1 Tax=Pseudoloma neurophilia TaxID=146866 RepID=A0A0R0M6D4_9MICR|nr:hypothetical protein M153_220003356 [Pseudoloma neurophilia]
MKTDEILQEFEQMTRKGPFRSFVHKIHTVNDQGPLHFHTLHCPNGIFILLADGSCELIQNEKDSIVYANKKLLKEKPVTISKKTPFMKIDGQPISLPFKFKLLEFNTSEYKILGLEILHKK